MDFLPFLTFLANFFHFFPKNVLTNVNFCFKVLFVTFVVFLLTKGGENFMNILNLFLNTFLSKNFMINLVIEIIFIEISLTFFQFFFKIQLSKKNNLIYLFINTIGFITGNLLGNRFYTYSFMLIFSILFMIYGLRISSFKALSFFNLLTISLINIQFCISNALCIINSCDLNLQIIESPICSIASIILMSIVGIIIYICTKYYKIDNLFIHSLHQFSNLIAGISILNLLIVCIISSYFFEIFGQNIFYILALDLYFCLSLTIIIQLCYSAYTKQKINNLKLCNKTILSMYDNTRTFKHDFHNIIQAIGGYVITNDMDGLKKYYSQISKDCINSNNLAKLNPELINNPAIYNILADKYYLANSYNIDINLDVMLDLSNLNMNIYELTRILGILLDNAIEASKECNEKNINISFKKDHQKQMLIIENTYANKQICIDQIFDKDFTTKPHNTGLGLWEVKRILSKNNNLNLHTTKNNDYFSQQLEIYSA